MCCVTFCTRNKPGKMHVNKYLYGNMCTYTSSKYDKDLFHPYFESSFLILAFPCLAELAEPISVQTCIYLLILFITKLKSKTDQIRPENKHAMFKFKLKFL